MGSQKKAYLLKKLRVQEGFVSGQELCDQLAISRTSVWKIINQLKEDGYQIEAVSNKGYRLIEEPEDKYNQSEIESYIQTKQMGQSVCFYECTDSTNADVKRLAEDGAAHGTIAVADRQDAGRGRRGRLWKSPSRSNVFFSILLRPMFSPDKAAGLTIVMALAVTKAIEEETGLSSWIKWPNDIVVNKKKVCGILTEMSAEVDYIQHVVIGTGINVNMEEIPEEIKDNATSLYLQGGKKVNRAKLLAGVLRYFEDLYELYSSTLDLSELKEEYHSHLISMNNEVKVLDPKGEFCGVSRGINNQGELLVEKTEGEIIPVYAGEVSVRGVYGYV